MVATTKRKSARCACGFRGCILGVLSFCLSLFTGALIGYASDSGQEDYARVRSGRLNLRNMPGWNPDATNSFPKDSSVDGLAASSTTSAKIKSSTSSTTSAKIKSSTNNSHLVPWSRARDECFQLASGSSNVFLSVRAEHRAWPASNAFAGNNQAFISSFRVVKALTRNKKAVSLESCRHPGLYLRHNGANVIVEAPKAPNDAVWSVTEKENCIQLGSISMVGYFLRLDPSLQPTGRMDMAKGSKTCFQLRRPRPTKLSSDACDAASPSDAIKVASMADGGTPCQLIPISDCPEPVPGASIGEHSLCNTEDIQRDLKEGTCLVYGIGVSDNWDFEKAMAKKGCEVHAFDPTIDRPPSDESKRLPNLHFHRWGLAGETKESGSHKVAGTKSGATETSQPMYTLEDMMNRLGHSDRRLSVFKIDCEGCEWSSMAAVPGSLWDRIDQLSLELHYGIELMLDSEDQLKNAAAFADALKDHGFMDYRSDVRDGYQHHQRLLPALYDVGMPTGFCCRLSGFARQPRKAKQGMRKKTKIKPEEWLTLQDAIQHQTCFELVNSDSDVRLSVRSEHRPYPACSAFAGEGPGFASSFRVVDALAHVDGSHLSLESCEHPGHFLRHNGDIVAVEPPKVPRDAIWLKPADVESKCYNFRAYQYHGALRVDALASPSGLVRMDGDIDDSNCVRIKKTSPKIVSVEDCASNNVNDAIKVASMADGKPCNLIPEMTCKKRLPGTFLGEHGLCSTDAIDADLKQGTCLVYGVGISDDWEFEKAMARKGCEVHAFDPTIDKPPTDESKNLPNLHFHRWGLAGEVKLTGTHKVAGTKSGATQTEQPMLTLEAMMERLGHNEQRLSVFKVDCEGCEWAALAAVPPSIWNRIDQLSLELHYGIELMLDSAEQLKNAASVADALRQHGFADWRSDWRDGYEHHRLLLPELYDAGMPHGFCCRLNGFVRREAPELVGASNHDADVDI